MISAEARGAWREIETHLRPYVARRVASPADVDDVVQEVFVRMHRGLGELVDEERFGGWVYRIAARAVADHLRARARHPVARVPSTDEPSGDEPSSDELDTLEHDRWLQRDLAMCVALFVSRLPSPYREAITLTELEGLTQKDAAAMVGISLSGMKSRVQRGRALLRDMFEQCCKISVDARGRVTACEARAPEDVPPDCRAAVELWALRES